MFLFQGRNNNENKVNNWTWLSVDILNNGNGREGLNLAWTKKNQEVACFPSSGSGRPFIRRCRKTPQGHKGRECQAIISPSNLPIVPCSGICLGQKMHMRIEEGPGSGQVGEIKVIGQRKTKTWKNCPYISDLGHPFGIVLTSGGIHSLL